MDAVQQMLAVLLVLGGLAGVLWWLRSRGTAVIRTGRPSAGRRLQALERIALTPHHSLHLVQVDGRTLLIGLSPGGCNLLDTDTASPGARS